MVHLLEDKDSACFTRAQSSPEVMIKSHKPQEYIGVSGELGGGGGSPGDSGRDDERGNLEKDDLVRGNRRERGYSGGRASYWEGRIKSRTVFLCLFLIFYFMCVCILSSCMPVHYVHVYTGR